MIQFVNEVHLVGRVGQEPIIKQVGAKRVARLSIATNRYHRAKDGSWIEDTTWHSITAWQSNDVFIDGINKGDMVEVRGRFNTQRYTNSAGEEKTFTEVIANELHHADDPDQRQTPPPPSVDDMPLDEEPF